ncbi:hypothetical protein GpartN1_g7079.t1 [Galdieria partita]|uniref:Ferredoxin thioredoxin reductase alpha chain domain-containing protein n=1 Tax=Galdieria partita TaxID=83374 RepID=A0A9C7Q2J3_9RHOD|nr:hypothetical protein GpartN1_g6895.t1 [Galdieria partita]GJQ15288.1 hypothetical protein GpartN1_g7079.t1 [Galdieria partita]
MDWGMDQLCFQSTCPFLHRLSLHKKKGYLLQSHRWPKLLCLNHKKLLPILPSKMMSTFETQSEQRCGIRCGDLVQVKADLVVYHVPKMKGQGISLKDKVGKVIGFCDSYKGEPITANYPIVVEFTHDSLVFTSHLAVEELQRVQHNIQQ